MALQTASDLFLRDLGRLQNEEQMLVQMLPQERTECSVDQAAQTACADIERRTGQQVQALDRCFAALGTQPARVTSAVMKGLQQDHDAFIQERPSPEATVSFDLRELAQIKNYTAAAYRDLVDQAQQLGRTEVQRFLQDGLGEEEAMGQQLQRVGQQFRQRWVREPATVERR
jgi:ferritin-like metal-binding protein YciE